MIHTDAFVAAFEPSRAEIALTETEDGWRMTADPGPLCVGCRGDTLPVDASEAADWEGDGKPGATVWVQVPVLGRMEVYVAQLGHSSFVGAVRDGVITGQVRVHAMEQRTLGASHRVAAGQTPIAPVAEGSRFTLEPVEEGGCP